MVLVELRETVVIVLEVFRWFWCSLLRCFVVTR